MRHSRVTHVSLTALAALLVFSLGRAIGQSQQEHVHHMAHNVMPFDITKTVHIFRMTESGGAQRVIVKDKEYADQIALIQQHLQAEASRFQHGDYSDPATLHGTDMPGLKELERGAKRVNVSYVGLPDGAEIRFETTDLHMLTAIHRWFGAQLSQHGGDAKAE
jgi:hypothetical protein